ncbi:MULTISPECIES: hypothetical protein [Corynebacterium]|uniref:FCS-type domain-containing protein n=1 Tax=Corynebacterium aurimucosum TaxID=169292 RepID=A0A558GKT6_9CORY|nr:MULTISPECIES: hypothetical protein [Corynebacterium]MBU5655326.1 hypothetical protein [Corynebacterium aurimucosum]OFL23287.1 hypothetical protein HMPREF2781_00915 [Corynebacterium sp. HMSC062A03]OFP21408.1 hypothetical protein HMPREF2996_03940 [Corynebacterium sp. HMSC066C02]OFQ34679.1 hypothetical protein HMPREF2943_01800 [Corynebacterium sp. HMSC072D12]OFS40216.1 hypothetical protein HMPREF2896_04470 [Corynebacterium sp. HMSC069E04]
MIGTQDPQPGKPTRRGSATCQWCGKEIAQGGRGRPRKFCSPSCKQRAYEQRHNVAGTPIPANAVILTPEKADRLRDGLFELRCCAEDVATAASESASAEEMEELCAELVTLARKLEELR